MTMLLTTDLNDPQSRMEGLFPNLEHVPVSSFQAVLEILDEKTATKYEKGRVFELLVKAFLEVDKTQSERFDKVWLWSDWPGNRGESDTGVDVVARERDSGNIVAIQCKFYSSDNSIGLTELNKFLGKYSTDDFDSGIFVSTSAKWGRNAENALKNRSSKPVVRWGVDIFEKSSIDWTDFNLANPRALQRRTTKTIREYQKNALQDVMSGFCDSDRGKMIMACGSGKTFTALRIAEQMVGAGGNVLFLTPSISLLSQSIIDWANDAEIPLKTLAVCSDTRAGRRSSTDEDISPYDLSEPASTNAEKLVGRINQVDRDTNMTAIFSTYQSLDVVAEAQRNGLPQFDLIIADEAHRTTGVSLVGKNESNFRRVHDNDFIAARKRLYMTATPRIFGDRAKRKANEKQITIASMDDNAIYGPEFHRLGFGRAVELGILSPYKVVIFNVDQQEIATDLDDLLSAEQSEINMDNGARMVGCWNGLSKRGASGVDFREDTQPVKRAVAFCNVIRESKRFSEYFPQVIEKCIQAAGDDAINQLLCEVEHVDGTQNALYRSERLSWLRQEPGEGLCRILTNARCLTEGIDVPALDAVLFLQPRRSEIDVVQAVGRVMRRSEGKKFGYIILPIAQAPGASAQETLSSSAFRAVWQVINAIASHDDRFEAYINQLALTHEESKTDYLDDSTIADPRGEYQTDGDGNGEDEGAIQGTLLIAGTERMRDAILAKVVNKYADPGYWQKWAGNVREIAQRHETRIRALLDNPVSGVRPEFDQFLTGIRNNLNDGITEDDAIGMLSQHLIAKPVFDALFTDYAFSENNIVSRAMQNTLDSLEERGLEKETEGLEAFYRDVRVSVQGLKSASARQKVIANLYEKFFKEALPNASNLGIVYTPPAVVDYIVRSIEDVLQQEFGASISDEGVHILEPFCGTGTFVTRLLQSGLIRKEDLRRKYTSELHANEMLLLAYYIAAVNIEATYHDINEADEYQPFNGIVLTDTFQSAEEGDPMDKILFPSNNERIERQNALDIRVIMGNPPWSATGNRAYPTIDQKVREKYAAPSTQTRLSALYDPYVRAIRQASDRVLNSEKGGIVAFVTNGGFIDSNAFDGFRKSIAEEFHKVYCYNLRGNARTSGERRRREKGGVFDTGSQAGSAILILVKMPGASQGATIHYRDIGDYLTREQKLAILDDSRLVTTEWQTVTPNEHGDWINQRSAAFPTLRLLAPNDRSMTYEALTPTFDLQMQGIKTNRDAWCYTSSVEQLKSNIQSNVAFYNEQLEAFQKTNHSGPTSEITRVVRAFVTKDATRFHWSRENYQDLARGVKYEIDKTGFRVSAYRPFFKQNLYMNEELNNSIRTFPELFPFLESENLCISITSSGSNAQFSSLMTDAIVDWHLNGDSTCLPRYRYIQAQALTNQSGEDKPEWERVSNINPKALSEFRERYGEEVSEDDLFYYTYGVLHSEQYRETFAEDLSKVAARIPMASSAEDFYAFSKAGRMLADLHVNYETVAPYDLDEIYADGWIRDNSSALRVEKMTYGGVRPNLDKSTIIYNAGITLKSIPEEAHRYILGSRSALDWLVDRYEVSTHKASGIVKDPNDWGEERDNPRYIIDLIKRVTTVSVKTVDIVDNLPELAI